MLMKFRYVCDLTNQHADMFVIKLTNMLKPHHLNDNSLIIFKTEIIKKQTLSVNSVQ